MDKISDKIYVATTLTVILFFLYYLAYSGAKLYMQDICKQYVCFEFLSFGDFLATWVAILGLYFVVTSLDAWKNQDQYFNTKKSMEYVQLINEQMKFIGFKLNNFYPEGMFILKHKELHYVKEEYKKFINESKVFDNYNNLDRALTIHNHLYIEDLQKIKDKISKIIWGFENDITNIQSPINEGTQIYKGELVQIYIKYRDDIKELSSKVTELNKKLKDYSS